MKYKTTRKAIINGSLNIKKAGYCNLQHLLYNHQPIAYTSGVYGWNFDVYEVYGLTICTGYRNMPGERLEHISEYEKKARAILEDYENPAYKDVKGWEKKTAKLEKLLKEFCIKNGGAI